MWDNKVYSFLKYSFWGDFNKPFKNVKNFIFQTHLVDPQTLSSYCLHLLKAIVGKKGENSIFLMTHSKPHV